VSPSALIPGIACAAAASVLFNVGLAVQALDARAVSPEHGLRPALARRLVVRRRWLAGTALTILGWPLQILALTLAPVVLVEPALAIGLVALLALGSRMLGEPVGGRERLAVGGIGLAVAAVALVAPSRSDAVAGGVPLPLALGVLVLATATPYLLAGAGVRDSRAAMVGAGVGFALGAVTTKLAADALTAHAWGAATLWMVATGAASGVATLSEMSALQLRPAVEVAPVGLVVQTLVPIVVAPLLFGEALGATPLHGGALAGAVAVLLTAAVVLTRAPAVLAFVDAASTVSGTGTTPSDRSATTSRSSVRSDGAEPPALATTTSPGRTGP
jgi:hypothetical protein